ncbi:MAG TPA: cytidine deaminase [Puia sp.]|nr:cytidine deaminase [Puia sp.]
MSKRQYQFSYDEYNSAQELTASDAALLKTAQAVTVNAYAPYSHFRVGAAARLVNGEIVTGTNQENASFPAGICAERTLLSAAASLFPGVAVDVLAISYFNENGPSEQPISPCGICRQSLQEMEQRTGRPIRLILGSHTGKVFVVPEAGQLLPFAFTGEDLQ